MSLSLLITINFLAGVALLAALTYAMSRASRLRPHVSARDAVPAEAGTVRPITVRRRARVGAHERARVSASAATAARS